MTLKIDFPLKAGYGGAGRLDDFYEFDFETKVKVMLRFSKKISGERPSKSTFVTIQCFIFSARFSKFIIYFLIKLCFPYPKFESRVYNIKKTISEKSRVPDPLSLSPRDRCGAKCSMLGRRPAYGRTTVWSSTEAACTCSAATTATRGSTTSTTSASPLER